MMLYNELTATTIANACVLYKDTLMRLWSLHPSYLDNKALVAVWREGLLARAVLRDKTKGYRHHPQLERFRTHCAPVSAINNYLNAIALEAKRRGYQFDKSKIGPIRNRTRIAVTRGQLLFEYRHLYNKVQKRAADELCRMPDKNKLKAHPLFTVRKGGIASWETA